MPVGRFRPSCAAFLPAAGTLQGVDNFGWHVAFVVFGENLSGIERPTCIERSHGNDALAFSKQRRKHALIFHRHVRPAVGDGEGYIGAVAVLEAAYRNETADPKSRSGMDMLRGDVARAVEIEYVVFQGGNDQRCSARACDQQGEDEIETAFFAGVHGGGIYRATTGAT